MNRLRCPQLSKRPDEENLSRALSNALPEVPRPILEDVAEAMNQLDEYKDELTQIEQVREAVGNFGRRYRSYAQVQARRQALQLRQAQTEFDSQSRALHESRAQLEGAKAQLLAQEARLHALDQELRSARAALDELKADPAMLDARRLEDLQSAAARAELERDRAQQRCVVSRDNLARERAELTRCEQEERAAMSHCEAQAGQLGASAAEGGIADQHTRVLPGMLSAQGAPASQELFACVDSREAQVERIRALLRRSDRAARKRDEVEARCADRRASLESAETLARRADQALSQRAAELFVAWRSYLASLQQLHFEEPEIALAELSDWVSSMGYEHPMRERLERARQHAHALLAQRKAELAQESKRIEHQDGELAREQTLLLTGQQLEPVAPPTRNLTTRTGRVGAPLWKLLEFHEHVGAEERAGLEAALEASGMLDAWVSPAGELIDDTTQDAWLIPSTARPCSLLDYCVPGAAHGVEAERVRALLSSIAATTEDDIGADSWISARGQFRVGRIVGAHRKGAAQYLGHAAREAARQKRLAAIATERNSLAELRQALIAAEAVLDEDVRALTEELKRAPREDRLRAAHSDFVAAEGVRREAQGRLAQAEVERQEAQTALLSVRAELEQDAADLRLPMEEQALDSVGRALVQYRTLLLGLEHLLHARAKSVRARLSQSEREAQTAQQLQQDQASAELREHEHEEACARRDLLLSTAGAAIVELRARCSRQQLLRERGL